MSPQADSGAQRLPARTWPGARFVLDSLESSTL